MEQNAQLPPLFLLVLRYTMGCFCFSHDFNKTSVPARRKRKSREESQSNISYLPPQLYPRSYLQSSAVLTSRGCGVAPNFGTAELPFHYLRERDLTELLTDSQRDGGQREMRRLNDARITIELQRYEEEQARLDCLHRAQLDAVHCGGPASRAAGAFNDLTRSATY